MKPLDFIAKILPGAQACQRATGIPTSFTIAQAALESAWGEKARGNNLFGIKADRAWKGATIDFQTHEILKGVRVEITDTFRAYPDWAASVADRADFFRKNSRYAACFKETTGEGWARAVAAAGYATDPHYAKTLVAIMDGRNMKQYDVLPKVAP